MTDTTAIRLTQPADSTAENDAIDAIARAYAMREAKERYDEKPSQEDYNTAFRVLAFAQSRSAVTPEAISDGDVVDIMIRGVEFTRAGGPGFALITLPDGPQVTIPVDHHSVAVTRIAPEWWPPRAGDIINTYALAPTDGTPPDPWHVPEHFAVQPVPYVARDVYDPEGGPLGVKLYPVNGEEGATGDDPHKIAARSWRTPELIFRINS